MIEQAIQHDMKPIKAIGYARVSTALQGKEGYSLEAQEEAIRKYCTENNMELLDVHTEVESGRSSKREVVNKVLNLCKITSAKLVISRLDRLTRDLHFLTSLQKSDLEFIALDNPSADRLVIQILTSIAENESVNISKRTKFALDLVKKKGITLGNYKSIIALYTRLESGFPTQWEKYAKLRRKHHKYLVGHKRYKELCDILDPVYEKVETSFGWDEWIRKSNQWGHKQTFEEEYEYWEWVKMKLSKLVPEDEFRSELWDGIKEYNHLIETRFGVSVGKGATAPWLLPFLDRKKKRKGHDYEIKAGINTNWVAVDQSKDDSFFSKVKSAWDDCAKNNTAIPTAVRVEKAKQEALDYLPHIREARAEGVQGIRPLCRWLDDKGITTKTGKKFSDTPLSLSKLLKLLEGQTGI